jgi:uncharacterized protein (TIGR02453 family)
MESWRARASDQSSSRSSKSSAPNNNRDWFAANKQRYEEDVLEPALEFIVAFAPQLEKISPHFRADARPSGGSLFRIYRDTRFSKDKSPYKTNLGIHFRHEQAKDAHAPASTCTSVRTRSSRVQGCGIRHGDGEPGQAGDRRRSERWRKATRTGGFAKRLELGGDSLKRVPTWADVDHRYADDLRRKDFFGSTRLDRADIVGSGFVREYVSVCRAAAPLVHFLCDAVGVEF